MSFWLIVFIVLLPFDQVHYVPIGALQPGKGHGVTLLNPEGRTWFVQMMSCIRAEILKRALPSA